MSDLAFNNYCLTCDKLCSQNSIYCSDECRAVDEFNSSNIIAQNTQHELERTSVSSNEELVSPLLTPSLYQHYNQQQNIDVNSSPLLLSTNHSTQASRDLDYFDLNYSVKSKTNYALSTATTASTSGTDLISAAVAIPSTSHNYRKWLTACL
ncbi:predicted protein [Scheffersomyces stipitis CBS 6054]|uniref:Uncharacterized protein n=1 Tax=Scheffersomyces stipitis (strain ATCC 58785 / CBS 6054 / NBRC 10063 / NRRL Y-11545) TaxID=322104 RepID=A3LRM7_PICST|nr:predicted protein [Scheffersomyces stipitis CBS 6054]ABN65412.1 predicted protein [Scheffersomyces stipitis CBS 6054]KAG2733557.1 hypothetical protein G9P44_003082 [Scheffersomyces stipitis]